MLEYIIEMGKFQKGHKVGAPSPAKRKKVYSKHSKNLYAHLLQTFISFFLFTFDIQKSQVSCQNTYCKKNIKNYPEIYILT